MKRKYLEPALLGLILLAIIVLAAYPYLRAGRGSSTETSDTGSLTETKDRRYSTDTKELRDRFNQDKGKVRLLLLLSPT